MQRNPKLLPLVIALAAGSFTPGAASQELEEILVTAQKRSQSVQDVPISITALSSDFIEDNNILQVTDLENYTPGLRIPQQDATKTFIRIRGVGSRKFDVGSEGSVGVFIDDIYIPRFSASDLGLLDLERVEILKGPQGTLFGRNTAAGALSVITQRPTEEFEGFVEGGGGNKDSYLVRGGVSGTVAEGLTMRLSAGQSEDGGFQTNSLTGNSDDRETTAGRLQALYQASDTLSIHAMAQYSEREQKALLQKSVATTPDGTTSPLFASPLIVPLAIDPGFRSYPVSYDGDIKGDYLISSLKIEKEFDAFTLVSLSGYQHGTSKVKTDFDGSPAEIGVNKFDESSDTYSQEFRLVGANWLGGVYYYQDEADSSYEFTWGPDSLQALLAPANPFIYDNAPIDVKTTNWAVFGEYTYDFNEQWALTVGGRYSYEEKDFTLKGESTQPGLPAVVAPYVYSDDENWDSFDPKVSLTYQMTDDAMAYLTYSKGNKSGGIQFTAISEALARELFDPEDLYSYELGFKSELLDRSLRLNASAFYYDYKDLQVQRVDLELSGGLPAAFTSNAASSDIYGFETDINWVPTEALNLRLGYAYLDATFNDFTPAPDQDYSGNHLPASPEHTLIAGGSYTLPLPADWGLTLATDWIWVDDFYFDVTEDDPYTQQDAYALGSVNLIVRSPDDSLSFNAFVQNVTDKDYYSQKTRRSTEVIASAGQGRRYGITVRYNF
jgi:iron complex outermembrane receptor protein